MAFAAEPFVLTDKACRAIFENAYDTIVVLDGQGIVRYESDAVRRNLGYDPAERELRNATELVHPDDVDAMRVVFQDLLTGRTQQARTEVRARHKDGSWRILEATITNLLNDPTVRGIVIVSRDVTEEREARASADNSVDRLLSLQAVGDMLSTTMSVEQVATIVVSRSMAATGAVSGVIGLRDERDCLQLMAQPGRVRKFPMTQSIEGGEAVWVESDVRRVRPLAALPISLNGHSDSADFVR